VPTQTDQPFGNIRRNGAFSRLFDAWGSRLRFGAPLRRYLVPTPDHLVNLGRCRLSFDISADASQIEISPRARVPAPPFWFWIGGELIGCNAIIPPPNDTAPADSVTLQVTRGTAGRWGATQRPHVAGTPALLARVPGIIVHSKLMVIDDIFLSVGSANICRRSMFHDAETNCFAVPEHLRLDPMNPARALRCRLWAEHLGLPPDMGPSLLSDPLSALTLFDRSWYCGSRWQNTSAFGADAPAFGFGTSDSIFKQALDALVATQIESHKSEIWRTMVDPTCDTDPNAMSDPGPELL
jgi:hypothetical protein